MVDNDKAHVLVVEDEEDLASLVELNLELAGYRVSVVSNGQEAVDFVRADAPALVLLDVMMPVRNGWEVLRDVKSDPELQDVPVVMLTAMAEERDLIRGHLQGAVRYITKPFEMQHLLATVEEALAPASDEEIAARRVRTRELLRRLAELDSGREAGGPRIALSRLEHRHEARPSAAHVDAARLDELTEHQRYIAEQMAAGRGARELAEELDVSRSNIYATRKRIARKLGVTPDEVAEETARLLDAR